MQFSKTKYEEINPSSGPDEVYDIIDYQRELSEGDEEEQRVREGQLLQPHAPSKTTYTHALSRIVNASNQEKHSSSKDVPAAARHLVSHDHVTTVTPELAALLASDMEHFSKSFKERTSKNIDLLEALLAKVPDGQTHLQQHIDHVLSNERATREEAESMEGFANDLKNGDVVLKSGAWLNRKDRDRS